MRYWEQGAVLSLFGFIIKVSNTQVNRHSFFSEQLALWMFHADWHYTTLLCVTIECVDALPDDGDKLINELLLRFPERPPQIVLFDFLRSSDRLKKWFVRGISVPKIRRIHLENPAPEKPVANEQPSAQPSSIDSIGALAEWLTITPQQLDWLANLWRFDSNTPENLRHYRYRLLEKRTGGMRLIEQPKPVMKRVQRKIHDEILSQLDVHPAAHGFCKNRNCLSHASKHVGKRYLLLFDLSNCFHSIGWSSVKAVFKRLGYSERVCVYLTALCTHSVRLGRAELDSFDLAQRAQLKQRHLPQGAPSSPSLANAALHRLDLRLTGLAEHFGMDYSRYADDIAMSSNRQRDWRFLQPFVGRICLEEGVALNYRKTRIKKSHQKQRVVGIVVNSKTNVDRKYFDTLKAILTNSAKFGLESQNRHNHPHFRTHLLGRIQYVKSLNEQRGLKLERLYSEIR